MLDLECVESFVTVAELRSFTQAAGALGTTQPIVSARVKKLETALGRRLLDRHPRLVRLSAGGEAFLPAARNLMKAHQDAVMLSAPERVRLRIGISEHVAGPRLHEVVARLAQASPRLALSMAIDLSSELLKDFDAGRFDAVIVRDEGAGRDGECIREDAYGWFAAPQLNFPAGAAIPLVTVSAVCGLRAAAIRCLDAAGVQWFEAFSGGGVASVCAALQAGLGVAPLSARVAPIGMEGIGPHLGLPPLPPARVMLHARASAPEHAPALRALTAALRSVA